MTSDDFIVEQLLDLSDQVSDYSNRTTTCYLRCMKESFACASEKQKDAEIENVINGVEHPTMIMSGNIGQRMAREETVFDLSFLSDAESVACKYAYASNGNSETVMRYAHRLLSKIDSVKQESKEVIRSTYIKFVSKALQQRQMLAKANRRNTR